MPSGSRRVPSLSDLDVTPSTLTTVASRPSLDSSCGRKALANALGSSRRSLTHRPSETARRPSGRTSPPALQLPAHGTLAARSSVFAYRHKTIRTASAVSPRSPRRRTNSPICVVELHAAAPVPSTSGIPPTEVVATSPPFPRGYAAHSRIQRYYRAPPIPTAQAFFPDSGPRFGTRILTLYPPRSPSPRRPT